MVSVSPLTTNSVPSVVTKAGTSSRMVMAALTDADAGRGGERRQHRQPHGCAGGRGEEHDERRERVDHADRQVELADDQHHHLAGGDDRRGGGVVDQVGDVVGGQEGAGGRLKIDDEQEGRGNDADLAPAQENVPDALPQAATRHRLAHRARAGRVAIRGWISPHGSSPPQAAIGPLRSITFSSGELPSKRLCVARYGSTLSLVTNLRPVLISAGPVRPPESLNMAISITV